MKLKDRVIGILGILISVILSVSLRGKGMETGAFPSIFYSTSYIKSTLLLGMGNNYMSQKFNNGMYFTLTLVYMTDYSMGFTSQLFFHKRVPYHYRYPAKAHIILTFSSLISLALWFIFSYLVGIKMPAILFA